MDQFSITQKHSILTLGEEDGKHWRYFLYPVVYLPCVSAFSCCRAHRVVMFVACMVAKKLVAIVNDLLLLTITIKSFVLKCLIWLVGGVAQVCRLCWDLFPVLRLSTGPLLRFHFTLHCEIWESWPWSVPCHSDTHNVECVEKMRVQYELVQGKCEEKVQICKVSVTALGVVAMVQLSLQ